jgi:hypothetical protein
MTSINWFNILKLAAAFALALGAHAITPNANVQALADVVAVVIAQVTRCGKQFSTANALEAGSKPTAASAPPSSSRGCT